MFYFRYLRSELVLRRTRTVITLAGLGLGVALVVAITGLSGGSTMRSTRRWTRSPASAPT